LKAIDWYINEFNRRGSGGGGGAGGFRLFGTPLQNFTGALSKIINIYLESSAQELSIGTLFQVSGGTVEEL